MDNIDYEELDDSYVHIEKIHKLHRNKFNKHDVKRWEESGKQTTSPNQVRIYKKRVNHKSSSIFSDIETLDKIEKLPEYRDELIEYTGKTIVIRGKVTKVKSLDTKNSRITLTEMSVNNKSVKFDHINIVVGKTWLRNNDDFKIGAIAEFEGKVHEYVKKNSNKKNIGVFAKKGKIIRG